MTTTLLLIAACILGLLGLIAGILALRTLSKLRASVRVLNRALGRESFVEVQAHHMQLATDAARGVDELRARLDSELASVQMRLDAAVAALRADHHSALAQERASTSGDVDAQRRGDSHGEGKVHREGEMHRGGGVDRDGKLHGGGEVNGDGEMHRDGDATVAAVRAELAAAERSLQEQAALARTELSELVGAQRTELTADVSSGQELVRAALADARGVVDASLHRVALIRFDAFDDLSGRLSFCLALLDGRGDGIALTSLAGQSDTRLYARPITAGSSELELIPEEKQAVRAALAV